MVRSRRSLLVTMPRVFGIVLLLTTVAMAIFAPPLSGFDESAHVLRAYQVSELRWIPRTSGEVGVGSFPVALNEDLTRTANELLLPGKDHTSFLDHLSDPAPEGDRQPVRIGAIAGYGPVLYFPAALGIGIGRVVGTSTLVFVYLARIANAIVYTLLCVLAVTRARRARWFFAVAALVPGAVFAASTVTVDGLTYALVLVTLALAVRGISDTDRWRSADTRLACFAGVALGLAKPPYALVALLLLAVAFRHHGGRRIWLILASVVPTALAAGWAVLMEKPLSVHEIAFGSIEGVDRFHPYTNVDSGKQLTKHVLGDPIGFLNVLGRTIGDYGLGWLRDAPAQLRIGSTTTLGVAILAWVALALGALSSPGAVEGFVDPTTTGSIPRVGGPNVGRWRRVGLFVVGLVLALATLVGAYTSWNAVGAKRIDAYQGRYLLAVCPLLVLALVVGRNKPRPRRTGTVGVALAFAAVVWYGVLLLDAFYS